jgi:hypothetical protein
MGPHQPSGYSPPPRMTPPPAHWRPMHVVEPAEPRNLPRQDHNAIDAAEERAAAVTRAFGIGAAAVLTLLLAFVCAQAIF